MISLLIEAIALDFDIFREAERTFSTIVEKNST